MSHIWLGLSLKVPFNTVERNTTGKIAWEKLPLGDVTMFSDPAYQLVSNTL